MCCGHKLDLELFNRLSLRMTSLMSELDPQVKVLLEQFKAMAAQQPALDHSPSIDERVAGFRAMMKFFISLQGVSESVFRVKGFDIPSSAANIPARLYVPSADSVLPALVYYHGGGFVAGDLDDYDKPLRALANRAGCIVISVAYRIAPENPYPAAADDAWIALEWVATHASEIGTDAQRLAVGGDSTGGGLAAWVAQKARESGPTLRLQVLYYPNLDATTSSASWRELGTGAYALKHDEMIERYNVYLPSGTNRKDPKVSPLYSSNLKGVAPAFLITAEYDPLRDEGNEYAVKLTAAHVAVDHKEMPGMIHGLFSLAGVVDAGKLLIDETGVALRKAFR
jgi:acetyl esterase